MYVCIFVRKYVGIYVCMTVEGYSVREGVWVHACVRACVRAFMCVHARSSKRKICVRLSKCARACRSLHALVHARASGRTQASQVMEHKHACLVYGIDIRVATGQCVPTRAPPRASACACARACARAHTRIRACASDRPGRPPHPALSFARTSAPCASSAAAISACPLRAARWSGVHLRRIALAHTPPARAVGAAV
jgi:hypothetical protein